MKTALLTLSIGCSVVFVSVVGFAQTAGNGPYKILQTVKTGGTGGFDYVYADSAGRRLYVPRTGADASRIDVFNLDTLASAGAIPNTNARGVAVDPKTHHGFATSKPVAMFDSTTLAIIKTIDVSGNPDGILFDPFNSHVYILSHSAPNATVIDSKDGSILGTIDLGGAPEQAVADEAGHIYVDIEDKANIAVVDAKTMAVTAQYDLAGKGGTCAGLAIDRTTHVLFAACREPRTMVILNAADGHILDTQPIGMGTDGAVFNPATKEVFSSQGDGTLTIIKETSPTAFAVEQTVTTPKRAKTLTLDSKTDRLLLITAEFLAPPPTPAGGRPSRGAMVPNTFSIVVVGK